MTQKLDLLFHSDLSPELCRARMLDEMDVDDWTLFSFSGYKGHRPILGRIQNDEFRLHKRRYWHNSWGPVLFGRIAADWNGARVEAYWDIWKWTRLSTHLWTVLGLLFGAPIFLMSVRDAIAAKSVKVDDVWIGLLVPVLLLSWALGFLYLEER
jgi:hypothetical protein